MLDNGQHILLGAYRETLDLMQILGVDLTAALERVPMRLGVLQTSRWAWRDYVSLASVLAAWTLRGFTCPQAMTVMALSKQASKKVFSEVIEPLCLSALNTGPSEASGQVFLRVLKDAFLSKSYAWAGGKYASSDMLIPNIDLTTLLPSQVQKALQARGSGVRLGTRVTELGPLQNEFDHIVIATPPWEAARLLRDIAPDWAASVDTLQYRAIATVYAKAPEGFELQRAGRNVPMLALPSDGKNPDPACRPCWARETGTAIDWIAAIQSVQPFGTIISRSIFEPSLFLK